MKLKRNVVMLPTNDKAVNKGDLVLNSGHSMFVASDNMRPNTAISDYYKAQHLYITSDEEIKEGDYILYDNRIGTYRYDSITDTHDIVTSIGTFPFQTKEYFKKIIATTDKSLGLPYPSDGFVVKFIEKYNAGTPITEVMVEYEGHCGLSGIECHTFYNRNQDCNNCNVIKANAKLKVDSNNCITITAVKDSWTRKEVVQLCFRAFIQHKVVDGKITTSAAEELYEPFNKWIEENI